jgi:hypothetical protein
MKPLYTHTSQSLTCVEEFYRLTTTYGVWGVCVCVRERERERERERKYMCALAHVGMLQIQR